MCQFEQRNERGWSSTPHELRSPKGQREAEKDVLFRLEQAQRLLRKADRLTARKPTNPINPLAVSLPP